MEHFSVVVETKVLSPIYFSRGKKYWFQMILGIKKN